MTRNRDTVPTTFLFSIVTLWMGNIDRPHPLQQRRQTEHAPTVEISQGRRLPSASNFLLGRRNEQHSDTFDHH